MTEPEQPKFSVDEDWKAQVQREKEQARAAREGGAAASPESAGAASGPDARKPGPSDPTPPGGEAASETPSPSASESVAADYAAAGAEQDSRGGDQAFPPAEFMAIISMLGSQALWALGQMPNPADGQRELNLPLAKHMIDSLGILEEKTRGNLTSEEAHTLGQMLHELRVGYVEISRQVQQQRGR